MTLRVVEKKESEKLETGRSSPTEVDEPGHLRNLKNFFFSLVFEVIVSILRSRALLWVLQI